MLPELLVNNRRRRRGPFYEEEETPTLVAPVPEPRPVAIPAETPAPLVRRVDLASVPVPTHTPPLTRTGPRGRPQILPGHESDIEAQRQLRGEIQSYEPKRRMGWKDFGLSALQGFLVGGIPGAAAHSLQRVIRPTFEDELWQQGQLRRTDANIDQLLQERRLGMQDELLQSQVEENRAQAERARQPPRPILGRESLPTGEVIATELNRETGQYEPLLRDGQPVVLTRPKPERRVEVETPSGRLLVSPEAALGYYGAVQGRADSAERRNEERQLQRDAAQDEFDQLVVDEQAALTEKDRAYAYLEQLKTHYNTLLANPKTSAEALNRAEDDIREATRAAESANTFYRSFGSKKATAQSKVKRYSTPLTRNPPPPPGVTEASVRAEARRRNEDEDAAVQRAKSFGWIP